MPANKHQGQKRKPRKLHKGLAVCFHCGADFMTPMRTTICPACWKAGKRNQAPNYNKKPQGQKKPQQPHRQPTRPQREPAQQQAQAPISKSSSIANRTTRTSAPMMPGKRSIASALQRLLMMVLDPASTSGQRAVRLNIDNIAAPKYPVQFDCNFRIDCVNNCKIMLASSPLISVVIFNPGVVASEVNVTGAQSFTVSTPAGYYTYVIGNKKNLVVDDEGQLVVKSKEDFRQFRMIASSMQLQWCGQEIFKNGIYNIARITDSENLSTFRPNQKIDSVIANVSDVVVVSSQRATATSPLLPVDPNNEDAGGVRPDGGQKQAVENVVMAGGLPGALDSGTGSYVFASLTTFRDLATSIATAMKTFYNNNAEYKRVFDTWLSALIGKYPEFYNASSNTYNCQLEGEWNVTASLSSGYQSFNFVGKPATTLLAAGANNKFFDNMLDDIVGAVRTAILTPNETGNLAIVHLLTVAIKIPVNGKINQRVQIPNFLTLGVDENSLADTVYYDNGFLEPVVEANGENLSIQVTTAHSFEFLLADDTVLAAAAVANTPKDPEAVIDQRSHARFQKIMKGMPPGLIQGDLGLGRITCSQLASRGIIGDIYSVLGPLATSVMPSAAPVINAIGGVIDNF